MTPTRRTVSTVWIVVLCILLVAVSALAYVLVNREWKAKDEIAALEAEVETLRSQEEAAQAAIDSVIPLQDENNALRAEVENLNDLLSDRTKELEDSDAALQKALAEAEALSDKNEALTDEAESLTEQLRVANESLTRERDLVISLTKEKNELQAAIEEANQRINNALDLLK